MNTTVKLNYLLLPNFLALHKDQAKVNMKYTSLHKHNCWSDIILILQIEVKTQTSQEEPTAH